MITMRMMMLDFARVGCSYKMFHAHGQLILCKPDLAHGKHRDSECNAHSRVILGTNCARTANFVNRVATGGGFWARTGRILWIDCARKLDFANGLRRKG